MIAHGDAWLPMAFSDARRFFPSPSTQILPQPWSQSQSHAFTLPADPATPMIMVGADAAGVPTFRSLLEQRKATGATGEHWLLVGDGRRAGSAEALFTDALISEYLRDGFLSRFDATSDDQHERRPGFHHRLFDHARGLWAWIDFGASLYVWANPTRVAEIEATLTELIAEQGRMSDDHAVDFLAQMAGERRYQRSFN